VAGFIALIPVNGLVRLVEYPLDLTRRSTLWPRRRPLAICRCTCGWWYLGPATVARRAAGERPPLKSAISKVGARNRIDVSYTNAWTTFVRARQGATETGATRR
jgi:hypothetical protein